MTKLLSTDEQLAWIDQTWYINRLTDLQNHI